MDSALRTSYEPDLYVRHCSSENSGPCGTAEDCCLSTDLRHVCMPIYNAGMSSLKSLRHVCMSFFYFTVNSCAFVICLSCAVLHSCFMLRVECLGIL